jgi:NTE family protein
MQIHRLRHIIAELAMRFPYSERESNLVREMAGYGCLTRMHVVRLLAPPLEGEDHTKDIDFSRKGIRRRWAAGYSDTSRMLADAPWEVEVGASIFTNAAQRPDQWADPSVNSHYRSR